MLYFDYTWDLNPNSIILDSDLDLKKLQWKPGDYWQLQEQDGKIVFKKVDPLLQFIIKGTIDGHS